MAGSLLVLLAITASLLDPAVSAPQSLTNSYLPPPPVEPKCRLETRTVEEVEEEEVCNTIQVQVKYSYSYNTYCCAMSWVFEWQYFSQGGEWGCIICAAGR